MKHRYGYPVIAAAFMAARMIRVVCIACVALLMAASCSSPPEGLLQNGSFERGEPLPEGWETMVGARTGDSERATTVELDTETAHTGKRSVRISGETTTHVWHALAFGPVPVTAGTRYRLDGFMKTDDVKPTSRQYRNSNIFIMFVDAEGRTIRLPNGSQVSASTVLTGTNDWTPVETEAVAPEGAVTATIGCFLSCSGTAWFDDVSFDEAPE